MDEEVTSMSYSILIKVSRNKLTFWYQKEGRRYLPLKSDEGNEIPLFFYSNGSDFIMGGSAKIRVDQNDPHAFSDYFDIIRKPLFYSRMGESRQAKQLLYDGIEKYLFDHFLSGILFTQESIEKYRSSLCLRFWFDIDIEEHEQILVQGLFTEAGYSNVAKIDFYESLLAYLRNCNLLENKKDIIVLNSLFNNLHIQYITLPEKQLKHSDCLLGCGSDPRLSIFAQTIIEYIKNNRRDIDSENEIKFIIPTISKFLKSPKILIEGDVQLSSGEVHKFRVRLHQLEQNMLGHNGFGKIFNSLENIVERFKISLNNLLVLVIDPEINTEYFIQKLGSRYNVKGVDDETYDQVIDLIFMDIEASGYSLANDSTAHSPYNQFNLPTPKLPSSPVAPPLPKPVNKPVPPPLPKPVAPPIPKPVNKPVPPPLPKPVAPPIPKPMSKPVAPPIPKPGAPPELPPIPKAKR